MYTSAKAGILSPRKAGLVVSGSSGRDSLASMCFTWLWTRPPKRLSLNFLSYALPMRLWKEKKRVLLLMLQLLYILLTLHNIWSIYSLIERIFFRYQHETCSSASLKPYLYQALFIWSLSKIMRIGLQQVK